MGCLWLLGGNLVGVEVMERGLCGIETQESEQGVTASTLREEKTKYM